MEPRCSTCHGWPSLRGQESCEHEACSCEPIEDRYVRVARELVRSVPGRVISAGQVAYLAHGRPAGNLGNVDMDADMALMDSGLFERASFLGGKFSDITLWRAREGV